MRLETSELISRSGTYNRAAVRNQRLAILDEQPVYRLGLISYLRSLPGFTIVKETGDSVQFVEGLLDEQPDAVIMDIACYGGSNLDIINEIRTTFPTLPILVLSDFEESVFAKQVIRAGANGFIMKRSPTSEIRNAILTVLEGKSYLSDHVYNILIEELTQQCASSSSNGIDALNSREFQVFILMGKGLQPKEITNNLNLSRGTIEYNRKLMLKKLNLGNLRKLREFALAWVRANNIN
jgi:DNA-binding NarL/FixJ family response regulator